MLVPGQRAHFDQSLNNLDSNIVRLASLVEVSIHNSMEALLTHNLRQAAQVIAADEEINQLRYDIEQDSLRLIAMQQPAAGDLRHIIAAMLIASELERIADHAKGVARLVERIAVEFDLELSDLLPKMTKRVSKMLSESVQAYVTRNTVLAEKAIARDVKLDGHYQRLTSDLFNELDDPHSSVVLPTYLLWIGHNLERMGDRISNIAERVVFMVENRYIELDH